MISLSLTQISARIRAVYNPSQPPESPYPVNFLSPNLAPAAVLIPLLEKENGWHLLFIRRTVTPQDRHSGQVAFPGGRCNSGDANAESAALREAHEEVGVHPTDVRVLGSLRDMLTISNYRVTPVVGVVPWPYAFHPQPDEVDRIFTIPLSFLKDPKNRKVKYHQNELLAEPIPVIYFEHYEGEPLWGASARITLQFLSVLGFA